MLITLKLIYLIYFLINLQTTLCLFEFKKVEYNDNHGVQFTNDELLNAVNMGEQNFEHMKNSEVSISNSDVKLSYESPSYGQFLESLPNQQAKEINKIAQIILKASIQLYNFNCLLSRRSTKDGCAKIISSYTLPHSSVHQNCTLLKEQSNNLYTYRRLLPPNYVDGIHKMKVNPLPKTISNKFFDSQMLNVSNEHYDSTNEGILDPERNIALVQWAQFIEHDLAKTVFQTMSGNDDPIECCKSDFTHLAPRFTHPSCAPLKIESSSQFNDVIRCMNYVRSALGVHHNCKFGSAEQVNWCKLLYTSHTE